MTTAHCKCAGCIDYKERADAEEEADVENSVTEAQSDDPYDDPTYIPPDFWGDDDDDDKRRRRRIEGGSEDIVEDRVCTKTMEIVRELPYLRELLMSEGEDNILPLVETMDDVKEICMMEAESDPIMNQCTFYVSMAKRIDAEYTGSFWLNAFGNVKDQHHGCGAVVNMVNNAIDGGRVSDVRRLEVDEKEVYLRNEETGVLRRLIGASVMGAGAYLAHVCRSFDANNELITEGL